MFSRWYFEDEERRCYNFVYSGCGRNGNNFKTYLGCMRKCAYGKQREELKKKDERFPKSSDSNVKNGTRRRRYHMYRSGTHCCAKRLNKNVTKVKTQ
ncbi:amyloid beta A4 protein [Trichonephila inaurata madagascariensis]|uniref:Amyloid beta A4 protein n=1 Tax=Trichonephila inaurata madagascariensis TaxID=2747483 RepID=A0A8X6YBY2_9ARAC|nr:amyloid beta A4 protein [Trichonephila inaurata madagascariensis]